MIDQVSGHARISHVFMTPVIGRARELEHLCTLVTRIDTRVVTVTGPGGVGKSRLAVAAGDRLSAQLGDHVWWVPLATIRDDELVVPAVAQTLGLSERGGGSWLEACARALNVGPALLIVDNVEHVLAGATQIAELVSLAPDLTILYTGRESLRIRGEREFPLAPLDASSHNGEPSDAVNLFVERARAVRPDFTLTPEIAPTVVEICHRLDGLPLAIELAAARTKVLAPNALLNRMSNRLQLLTGGPRDLPTRQQTMRDAMAWSYDLLHPDEKALFLMLSVFAGRAPLDAIEAMWARWSDGVETIALDGLESLVAKSLVTSLDTTATDSQPRYSMLETIREFGIEQLQQAGRIDAARALHAAWYADLAERSVKELTGSYRIGWLTRLDREHANLRAAASWAIESSDAHLALRFVAALWRFWDARGYLAEAATLSSRALDLPGEVPSRLRAEALYAASVMPARRGDYDEARRLALQLLAFCENHHDREGVAQAHNAIGLIDYDTGDLAAAETSHLAGLAIRREIGDAWLISISLINLGSLYLALGRFDDAREVFKEVRDLNQAPDKAFERAFALNGFGLIDHQKGDLSAAIAEHEEALTIRRADHDGGMLSTTLANLASAVLDAGDLPRAAKLGRESVQIRSTRGERRALAESFAIMARVAAASGQLELAARLLGAAKSLNQTGFRLPMPVERATERLASDVIRALGQQAYAAAFATGAAAPRDEMVTAALALTPSGAPVLPPAPAPAIPDVNLTPREREVLSLIAEGRSDREIGDALFITRATAARHVANIFLKIDVNSRTAAAAYAFRHGLV